MKLLRIVRGRVGVAVVHEVAGRVCLRRHGGKKRAVFHRLDLDLDADLLQIGGDQRQQLHVIGIAGADLNLEAEALRIAGFGQELLGLLGIVLEQLLHRVRHLFERLEVAESSPDAADRRTARRCRCSSPTTISCLFTAILSARRTRMSSNGLVSTRMARNWPDMLSQLRPLQRRRALLELLDVLPADVFQNIELGGAQRRDVGRLILDGAVDELVDERELVATRRRSSPCPSTAGFFA